MTGGRYGLEVVVLKPVELQLEGEGGLQVAVDPVLLELLPGPVGEVAGEGAGPEDNKGDPAHRGHYQPRQPALAAVRH